MHTYLHNYVHAYIRIMGALLNKLQLFVLAFLCPTRSVPLLLYYQNGAITSCILFGSHGIDTHPRHLLDCAHSTPIRQRRRALAHRNRGSRRKPARCEPRARTGMYEYLGTLLILMQILFLCSFYNYSNEFISITFLTSMYIFAFFPPFTSLIIIF
jgi:hypothetical protein